MLLNQVEISVLTKEGNEEVHLLKEGINLIGRKTQSDSEPDVAIETRDKNVSRKHCCIKVIKQPQWSKVILFDTSSRNGTSLIGYHKKLLSDFDKVYLENGDQIYIGDTKIIINIPLGLIPQKAVKNKRDKNIKSKTTREY